MRLSDILVDLAGVVSASRSIASKHVALRGQQLDRYRRTSGIITNLPRQSPSQEPVGKRHAEYEGSPREATPPDPNSLASHPEHAETTSSEVQTKPTAASSHPVPVPTSEDLSSSTESPLSSPEARPPFYKHPQAHQPKAPSNSPATGKAGFVPAPWANGSPSGLQQILPSAIRREPIITDNSSPNSKDFENIPPGVDLGIFHTRSASRILDSLREKEVVDTKAAGLSTSRIDPGRSCSSSPHQSRAAAELQQKSVAESQVEGGTVSNPPDKEMGASPIGATSNYDTTSSKISETGDRTGDNRLAYQLRESKVPSTRLGRMWNYSGLAVGMFAGALGEGLSRAVGGGGQGSIMLSTANMERLVAKLSRMRGAALKIGQLLSFQDAKMLPAPIQEVLQRVQDRADYMPGWQRDKVLASNLGPNWRDLFDEFEEKPIAAASIGQVHRATLKSTGTKVAVKIQFPGVADSINSDLDNLSMLLTATSLLPKGLYLHKTIDNSRTELGWECDYQREAECAQRYYKLLAGEDDVFQVPKVYPEGCGKQVLTMEYMEGVGVTRVKSFTQEQRDWIGTHILRLCLREITEFRFMQTDPNWTNFQYNPATNKLELLDFGASREYPNHFVDLYVRLLEAASRSDREAVKTLSEELGYLTGHESKTMLDAHITSVMTLAEPFLRSAPAVYDFRDQTITERVKAQIPVMIRERLAPPPEETYSLHRKLSGAFLLCAKLGSQVRCRELFQQALQTTGFLPKEA